MMPGGPLVFGGAPIGGLYAPVSEEAAAGTLQAAWDAGIRAFDTAPHYGVGLSERRIGDFLAGRPRAEFAVCTKVGRLLVPAAGSLEDAEGFYGTPALSRLRTTARTASCARWRTACAGCALDPVDIALIHDPDEHLAQASWTAPTPPWRSCARRARSGRSAWGSTPPRWPNGS